MTENDGSSPTLPSSPGPSPGGLTPERQRELLLRFRDDGVDDARAELLRELPRMLRQHVETRFAGESPAVRDRLARTATGMLEAVVTHTSMSRIRTAIGVDLVAETLDPVELEDELDGDPVGRQALAALEALCAGEEPDELITDATADARTRMIERVSELLLPLVRPHHVAGRFGVDYGQADLDRAQEVAGRALARLAAVIRSAPDKAITDESAKLEDRILDDPSLRAILEFDPREGYAAAKAEAQRIAEKAAAAKARRRHVTVRRSSAPGGSARSGSSRSKPRGLAGPLAGDIVPRPRPPSVLDSLSPREQQELVETIRENNRAWSQGDQFEDAAERDRFWDPVTERLEGLDAVTLKQMVALIRKQEVRVVRGFASEIERVLSRLP